MRLPAKQAPATAFRRLITLLALACVPAACDNGTEPPEARARVSGTVRDAQANTRLFFYDDDLNEITLLSIQVRQDGSYGPLAFPEGTFFGAGTASGSTTGQLVSFTIASEDETRTIDFDLDPITVPLAVGNRWTYEEQVFDPAATSTVEVAITAQQPAENVAAVFTVEERSADTVVVYYLAQDASGIRKSADPVIDASDELLLKLPATLGSTWSTVDFATGAPLQKRIKALACDSDGCEEVNDFTLVREPAGVFMSVSVLHTSGDTAFATAFSDIGIADSFVQNTTNGELVSQRKLIAFSPGAPPQL